MRAIYEKTLRGGKMAYNIGEQDHAEIEKKAFEVAKGYSVENN